MRCIARYPTAIGKFAYECANSIRVAESRPMSRGEKGFRRRIALEYERKHRTTTCDRMQHARLKIDSRLAASSFQPKCAQP